MKIITRTKEGFILPEGMNGVEWLRNKKSKQFEKFIESDESKFICLSKIYYIMITDKTGKRYYLANSPYFLTLWELQNYCEINKVLIYDVKIRYEQLDLNNCFID